jgi:hypothetical protein
MTIARWTKLVILTSLVMACGEAGSSPSIETGNDAAAGNAGTLGDGGSGGSRGFDGPVTDGGVGGAGQSGRGGSTGTSSECRITANTVLATDAAGDLRSDGRHVYYINDTRILKRVPVNGGEGTDLYQNVRAFAIGGGRVFYLSFEGEIGEVSQAGVATPFTVSQYPLWLATDGVRLFWHTKIPEAVNVFRIQQFSIPLSPGTAEVLRSFTIPAGLGEAAALLGPQVGAGSLWWLQSESLMRGDLEGNPGESVAVGRSFVVSDRALAVITQTALRVGPAADALRDVAAIDASGWTQVAAYDGDVYFARSDACASPTTCRGRFFSVSAASGSPREVFTSDGFPLALAVDSACIYFAQLAGSWDPMQGPFVCPTCTASLHAVPR